MNLGTAQQLQARRIWGTYSKSLHYYVWHIEGDSGKGPENEDSYTEAQFFQRLSKYPWTKCQQRWKSKGLSDETWWKYETLLVIGQKATSFTKLGVLWKIEATKDENGYLFCCGKYLSKEEEVSSYCYSKTGKDRSDLNIELLGKRTGSHRFRKLQLMHIAKNWESCGQIAVRLFQAEGHRTAIQLQICCVQDKRRFLKNQNQSFILSSKDNLAFKKPGSLFQKSPPKSSRPGRQSIMSNRITYQS